MKPKYEAPMSKLFAIGMVLLFTGGSVTAALAQSDLMFTACVSKKGKIKFLQEGNTPLKGCKGKQIQIMFPSTNKTDQLMETDTELMGDIDGLTTKTNQLTDKDTELMGDIDGLNSDVSSLNTDVAALQDEISGPIADQLQSLQDQIDNIVTSSVVGGGMSFFQTLGPGNEVGYLPMFGTALLAEGFEDSAVQNMAASGILTNLYVRSDELAPDATLTATLKIGGADSSLNCQITSGNESCSVTSCVQVNEGDLIVLRVNYVDDDASHETFDVRWNSRFVENGTCPEP